MKKGMIAIDIGSSNSKIYRLGAGVVLCEPSVVAVAAGEKRTVKAVGIDAKKLKNFIFSTLFVFYSQKPS